MFFLSISYHNIKALYFINIKYIPSHHNDMIWELVLYIIASPIDMRYDRDMILYDMILQQTKKTQQMANMMIILIIIIILIILEK